MFATEETYRAVRDSKILNRDLVKRLYSLEDDDILTCMFVSRVAL